MNRNRVFTYASLPLLLTPCQRHSDIGQSFCVWLNVIVTGMSVFCLHDTMSRCVCFITCIASDCVLSYIKAQGAFLGELSMEGIEESGAANSNLIITVSPTPYYTYTGDALRSLQDPNYHLLRSTRKLLFYYGLWRPAFSRKLDHLVPVSDSDETDRKSLSSSSASSTQLPSLSSLPCSALSEIRLATWNIHSINKKYVAVADTIISESLDLLVITESWHRLPTDVAVCRSVPPDYTFVDQPRVGDEDADSRGGGIIILHRSTLCVLKIPLTTTPTTFEALAASVSSPRGPLTILPVYRPGSSLPSLPFFSEFSTILHNFSLYNTQLVTTGDINLHLEDPTLPATVQFQAMIEQFGLTQHVAESTHRSDGWLDVILTRDDCSLVDLCIHPPTISDHGLVVATIPFLHDAPSYLARQIRGWRNLDRDAFRSALLEVPAIADPSILADFSVAAIFATYEPTMGDPTHKFLPLHT